MQADIKMRARSIKTEPSISKDTIEFRSAIFSAFTFTQKTTYVLFLITFFATGEAAKQRVCIVGAGVSGIVTAKYFAEFPDEFETIVFEKNSDVGGLWIYNNSTTVDEHGLPVHSSIYKSLRTNTATELMAFPDYSNFDGTNDGTSYKSHEDVLQYLRNYTDHFKLYRYIQVNTNVEKVTPLSNQRWLVVARNLNTNVTFETTCDSAIICNGPDVKGYIPKIDGIENFHGQVLHSHLYREPEIFTNKTVVLLGASYSGIQIGVDISSVAAKVYLSHRHDKLPDVFRPNVEQVPGVVAADGNKLILSNGTKIRADAFIFCTGYEYDIPFLDADSGIVIEDGKYIRSIYKHLINIERPTMALMNVPQPSLHFRMPHIQALYYREVLRGKLKLPSREEMLCDARLPANVPKSKAHVFPYDTLCAYMNELSLAAGGEPLPWWFLPAVDELGKVYDKDPIHFWNAKLVIHEDDRRVEVVPVVPVSTVSSSSSGL